MAAIRAAAQVSSLAVAYDEGLAQRVRESLLPRDLEEKKMFGRAMTGWVMVDPKGHETDSSLDFWLTLAMTLALSLPPK